MNFLYIADSKLPKRENEVLIGDDGTTFKYLSRAPISQVEGITLTQVGQWENNGAIDVIDETLYEQHFVSFANDENGFATDSLPLHTYQGHKQRKVQAAPVEETLPQFPADKQPFVVKMSRYEDIESGWPGWYWQFVIEWKDKNRHPGVRTVAIYDKDWVYQYTVGALVEEEFPISLSAVRDEPEPPETVLKWVGRCPAGRQTDKPEDIYYSLLYGSAIEGKMILKADEMEQVKFFWEHSHAIPTPIGEIKEWAAGISYSIGDVVTYKDIEYTCLQAHRSQSGWNPVVVPALWQRKKK